MTKRGEIEIVRIAERQVNKFIKRWKENSYLWESETDVHAELYMRIKLALRRKKYMPVEMTYKKDMNGSELFDLMYCKPKIYVAGKKNAYFPDIAIYKKTQKKYSVKKRENDPILWVCEIKYATDWSSNFSDENIKHDIVKLGRLLKQKKGGADYACCLILKRWKNKPKCKYARVLDAEPHGKIRKVIKDNNVKLIGEGELRESTLGNLYKKIHAHFFVAKYRKVESASVGGGKW